MPAGTWFIIFRANGKIKIEDPRKDLGKVKRRLENKVCRDAKIIIKKEQEEKIRLSL